MLAPADSLAELILAFRLGSQISRPTLHRDLFNERLTELVMAYLDSGDRRALDQIQSEGSQGLIAARAGASELAARHFTTAERLTATLPLHHGGRLCAESFLSAQGAYFVYTQRRYEDAAALLQRAYANDLRLETEHGFHILVMHRIQLLNNLMRIEARRERWREALVLGGLLLAYLEDPGGTAIRSLPPPWNRGWIDSLDAIPTELARATHAQIAREEVQALRRAAAAGNTADEISNMLGRITRGTRETQIGRWIDFQNIRMDASRGDYLAAAGAVLRHGSVPSEPLWRSVADDVISLLRPGLCRQATMRAAT